MAIKKCVSICNQFTESECNPPRCKYINGKTRKSYCRISHKYKTNKLNCNVTRRIKKKDLENVAKKRIQNFMKKSKTFLQIVCPESGVCTAFGDHTKELNHFFKGFTDFHYVKSPIHKIGAVSNNGFIKEIEYDNQGYKAHAILKCAQNPEADNLVYEYLVGIKYVNRLLQSFPCFVETYGLYYFDKEMNWKIMKGMGPIHYTNLKHLLPQKNIDYVKACQQSNYAALLIQHIKKAYGMNKMINERSFLKKDFLYTLFIVYHALACNSTKFTHYDLHSGNVLIYEPVPGKFIEYHYHNNDGTITSFFSSYIPKIIDYGRSFFDNGNTNSKKIYDKICSLKECNPDCGTDVGLSWLNPKSFLTISSSKKNESHDLRLLYDSNLIIMDIIVGYSISNSTTYKETEKLLNKVVYGVSLDEKYKQYGTKENLSISNNKIYNVKCAYDALKEVVENPDVIIENKQNYMNMANKLGDLHVYTDGREMKYEHMK